MRAPVLVAVIFSFLGIASVTDAQAATGSLPENPSIVEARDRIGRGEALFERGDFEGALVEFNHAYELADASPIRYLIHYNVGQCYERLHRYDAALEAYRRYLEEGGDQAEDRPTVLATIRVLEGTLANIDITTNVAAEVWVDDRRVGEAPGRVRVTGGRHAIELRAAGYESRGDDVSIPAGTTRTLDLPLTRLAEPFRGIDAAAFWTTAVVGTAALIVGSIFGGATLAERGRIDGLLADPVLRWTVGEPERANIRSLALTTDVLLGSAVVLAAASVALAFFTDWDGPRERSVGVGAAYLDGPFLLIGGDL